MPYFHSADWPSLLLLDRLRPSAAADRRRASAAETLEAHRIVDGQAEMAQLDLAVRARQRQRPRDGPAVVDTFRSAASRRPRESA